MTGLRKSELLAAVGLAGPSARNRLRSLFRSSPASALTEADLAELEVVRPHFDAEYYLATYPDIAQAGLDPLVHFHQFGWREHRNPNALFSTQVYLEANPDVAASGINPFWHFINVANDTSKADLPKSALAELEVMRPHFDAEFYLTSYPDVAQAGVDPLLHFYQFGWREYRDPNSSFSTRYYLEANPDIIAAGINPFWHYVIAGRHEGRPPRKPDGDMASFLEALLPLEERIQWHDAAEPSETLLGDSELSELLRERIPQGVDQLLVSVSHDDYRTTLGGVQLCIQHEGLLAAGLGRSYLNIHPWQLLPRLAHIDQQDDPLVEVVLDGHHIGTSRTSALASALAADRAIVGRVDVAIHHLMGHSPERIADLVTAANGGRCHLWLHDYFTISPGHALQRNDMIFCGAPVRHSNACTLCVYGEERQEHLDRMAAFFDRLSVHVIAPSDITRDFWSGRTALQPASLTVVPHLELTWVERAEPRSIDADRKPTIAFVGAPTTQKGWPVFQSVVERFRDSERFRFCYFGVSPRRVEPVEQIPVQVRAEDPAAMVNALRDAGVDLVLHWSSALETFSLSTYEALASGAFVLTNEKSGNVSEVVRKTGLGVVLPGQDALFEWLDSDDALSAVAEARKRRGTWEARLQRSSMTHSQLAEAPVQ